MKYSASEERKDRAKQLLIHYFNICSPGLRDDNDNRVEIREIVDHIVDAAVLAVQEELRPKAGIL